MALRRLRFIAFAGAVSFLGQTQLHADPILKIGEHYRVMPVGDSITLGKDSGAGVDGYRRILYEWLIDAGYTITYVGKQHLVKHGPGQNSDGTIAWHEGYGSFRTDMILNGGQAEGQKSPPLEITLKKFQPDVVLLMIGTNDIIQDYELATLEARLKQILTTIETANPETAVALASIAPILKKEWADKEPRVREYNTNLEGMVEALQEEGRKIVFVDVHSVLTEGKRRMARDGVHPRRLGYAYMAAAFYESLTGQKAPEVDPNNPALLPGREGNSEPDTR